MELVNLRRDGRKLYGYMLRMNREEAIRTIASLARQLESNNSNIDRAEETLADGRYFSISVKYEEPSEKAALSEYP